MKMTKVAFIGQPEYFACHYEGVVDEIYDVRYFGANFGKSIEYYRDLLKYNADVNIFFRGEFISEKILKKLDGVRVCISTEPFPKLLRGRFVFTRDSLSRFKYFFDHVHHDKFDYVFHYDESSRDFLELMGLYLSGYFPLPINTKIYSPTDGEQKVGERQWDMFFIGRSTPHREKFFGPLKREFRFLHIAHGVTGQDLLPYIRGSTINLNVHAEDETSWEPRTQMVLSCGGLLLSEPLSPGALLKAGTDFLEVVSPQETYERCADILRDPDRFDHIRRNGMKKVQKELDAKENFHDLIEKILGREYEKWRKCKESIHLGRFYIVSKYDNLDHILYEALNEHA